MKKGCGAGKSGPTQQKRILTYLMKGMNLDLSPSVVQKNFHQTVENARRKYSMHHKPEELKELPIEQFNACYAGIKIGEK